MWKTRRSWDTWKTVSGEPDWRPPRSLMPSQENGRAYDRDIGRSTTFNNKDYYIFGDTFCHDADGKFVGLSCNTLARIPRRHEPTECSYELVEDDGFVPEFIPFRKDENMFNEKGQRDQQRIALWCFSTIIEDSPGAKSGYIYFDKIAVVGHTFEPGMMLDSQKMNTERGGRRKSVRRRHLPRNRRLSRLHQRAASARRSVRARRTTVGKHVQSGA